MKQRPRRAEREIAAYLSNIYDGYGYSPVVRIPVLGRTGPDISINETKIVVDVKSRIACPKNMMIKEPIIFGDLVAVPLHLVDKIETFGTSSFRSITVRRWLDHMEEWTLENEPDGISVIVLHQPGVAFKMASFVFYQKDLRRFNEIWKTKK